MKVAKCWVFRRNDISATSGDNERKDENKTGTVL